jgi:hypothetical protein
MTQGCPGVYSRVNRDGLPTFGTAQMLARSADTSQVIKAFALRCYRVKLSAIRGQTTPVRSVFPW